jgi:FKBP-type peptidyl-prolyl cis-trans isomerase
VRFRSTFLLLAITLVIPLAAAGCGSSGKPAADPSTTPETTGSTPTTGETTTSAPADASPSTSEAPLTTAPGTTDPASDAVASAAGLPAVDHATDLKVAPVIAAGPGTPESTLVTRDLVVGTGTVAVATSTVRIQYVGALYTTGKVFDATWTRGATPATFGLNGVVPGFAQGIVGMKIGGRREIVIPPALGYGSKTNGPIPGNSTLVFIVDLLGVQ